MEYLKKVCGLMVFQLFQPLLERASTIGLGTGSTIKYFIDQLIKHGLYRGKELFVSSVDGVEALLAPHVVDSIDVYIDGFDEVSTNLDLVKGRGGAFYWEKILASRSRTRIYVADYSKWTGRPYLYLKPVPVEVEIGRWRNVFRVLDEWKLKPRLRLGKARDGPIVTDSGNYIIDLYPRIIEEPIEFDNRLHSVEGVIETGVFPNSLVDYVLVVGPTSSCIRLYRRVRVVN